MWEQNHSSFTGKPYHLPGPPYPSPTLSFILKTGVVKSTSQGVAMEVNDVTEYKSEYLVRGGILLLLVRTTEDG